MDEPTAGMAVRERAALMTLTEEIARQQGIGVLFTERHMDVVFGHPDRGSRAAARRNHRRGQPRCDPPEYPGARGLSRRGFNSSRFPMTILLEVQNLSASYGRAQVLFDISLQVRAGEVVALIGRNGAGKTTTLKAIMGLVAGRATRLDFSGHPIAGLPTYRIARLGLGYVAEDRRIFTDLTVDENLKSVAGNSEPGALHRPGSACSRSSPTSPKCGGGGEARCRAESSRCWRSPGR